jgi:ubiquinone/menaquinone biosynthesis C-methylase UbiE
VKARESGMPEEHVWDGFFSPAEFLGKMQLTRACRAVVDFGCGYGTFTIAAARITSGTVFALDLEAEMIASTQAKADAAGLKNVRASLRDFTAEGSGLRDAEVDYAMLFNILHAERPEALLGEAFRVLAPGGKLAIIHWNYDPSTPRGPSMAIRPRPEQCVAWAESAGFRLLPPGVVDLPPYHYGMALERLLGSGA